jgi:hypothetical protein
LGDAEELVRRCQGCQYFAKQQHVLAYKLVTIPPTWPFTCWGLDMIGFQLHHHIITDLGSNFNNHQFWEYYENSGIDVRYISIAHPWANGQVERANGMALDALKKRLHDAANSKGGKSIKELPNAL